MFFLKFSYRTVLNVGLILVTQALKFNLEPSSVKLFESLKILSKRELESRVEIKFDSYTNAKLVEFKLASDMTRRLIMPAILEHLNDLGGAFAQAKSVGISSAAFKSDFKALESLYAAMQTKLDTLKTFIETVEGEKDAYKRAYQAASKGVGYLQELRDDVDAAECLVSSNYWPLPSYDEMLLLI